MPVESQSELRRSKMTAPNRINKIHQRTSGLNKSNLAKAKSAIDGSGCFAATQFKKNQTVAEFIGEKISPAEGAARRRGRRRFAICALDEDWEIDAGVGGNYTRYLNHSCDPNCEVRIEAGHIMIYARRPILAGEEITVDYETSYHSNRKRCHCGAANCRGTINRMTDSEQLVRRPGDPRNTGEDFFPQTQ
jgi:SET domain-containing protein